MNLTQNRTPLILLAILALACSRTMFWLFDDPEGPNLLVVFGMALIVFFPSFVVYRFGSLGTGPGKLTLAIVLQLLVATGLYFLL